MDLVTEISDKPAAASRHTGVRPHDTDPPAIMSTFHISSIPRDIVTFCIGVYLTNFEACKWARCSSKSLAQLQQYGFKNTWEIPTMVSLSTMYRSPFAFGRITQVRIQTALEWAADLPMLPSYVDTVVEQIVEVELQQLYPVTERDQQGSTCCDYYQLFVPEEGEKVPPSPVVHLPSTVTHLTLHGHRPASERWFRHLIIPSDSRLRALIFSHGVNHWASLPPFLRHSLPDTLQELLLPWRMGSQVTHPEPTADQYPARWPTNLTKLFIPCSEYSTFAVSELPEFPSSLVTMCDVYSIHLSEPWGRDLMKKLPPSITFFQSADRNILDNTLKFPTGLLQLDLPYLTYVDNSASPLPPNLRQLSAPGLAPSKVLTTFWLPASLTSITLALDGSNEQQKQFEGVQWPPHLSSMSLHGDGHNRGKADLRGWNPPSTLTELTLRFWNMSLDEVQLPATLRSLTLEENNCSLARVFFPTTLVKLALIGRKKTPSIRAVEWNPPPQLTHLVLSAFQQGFLPLTLKRLTCDAEFPCTSLEALFEALPHNLEELDLSNVTFRHKLLTYNWSSLPLPKNLRRFYLLMDSIARRKAECWDSSRVLNLPTKFPHSLQELWLIARDHYPIGVLSQVFCWAESALPPHCLLLTSLRKSGV